MTPRTSSMITTGAVRMARYKREPLDEDSLNSFNEFLRRMNMPPVTQVENRHIRAMSLTNTAYNRLIELAGEFECYRPGTKTPNVSEFIERIGQEQYEVRDLTEFKKDIARRPR